MIQSNLPALRSARRMARRTALTAVAVALLVGCAPDGNDATSSPTVPTSSEADPATAGYVGVVRADPLEVGVHILPDVTDPNQRGGGIVEDGQLRFQAAPDRILVPYFGFTSCPDVCPTTFADMRVALREMDPALAERVDVAFVTIDERRDTPELLNTYLASFFERFHVVRAPEDPTREVASSFLASFTITGAGPETEVAHSATLYAVDETGKVRIEWPFGTRGVDIAADLERLFAELDAESAAAGSDGVGDV